MGGTQRLWYRFPSDRNAAASTDHRLRRAGQRGGVMAGHCRLHVANERQPGHAGLVRLWRHGNHRQRHQQRDHHPADRNTVFPAGESVKSSSSKAGPPPRGRRREARSPMRCDARPSHTFSRSSAIFPSSTIGLISYNPGTMFALNTDGAGNMILHIFIADATTDDQSFRDQMRL